MIPKDSVFNADFTIDKEAEAYLRNIGWFLNEDGEWDSCLGEASVKETLIVRVK